TDRGGRRWGAGSTPRAGPWPLTTTARGPRSTPADSSGARAASPPRASPARTEPPGRASAPACPARSRPATRGRGSTAVTGRDAGGVFSQAGGQSVNNVARWNGSRWADVAGGLVDPFQPLVFALRALSEVEGPGLYAAGEFAPAGGVLVRNLARFDGSGWA